MYEIKRKNGCAGDDFTGLDLNNLTHKNRIYSSTMPSEAQKK